MMVLLSAAGGAVRRAALCQDRTDRRALDDLVSQRLLVAHPHGVVALPEAPRAVVTARVTGGVLCCAHALEHHGLPLREPPGRPHVALPATRRGVPDGTGRAVVHWVRGLAPADPLVPPYAQVEDAVLSTMRCAEEVDALIALDAALRDGLVDRRQLAARLPGPANGRTRALLARAEPGARSLVETIARYDLQEAGQDPEVAVTRCGVELDLLLGGRLDLEVDGYAFHSDRVSFEADRVRALRLQAHGFEVVHVSARQVLARRTVEVVEPVARRYGCWR